MAEERSNAIKKYWNKAKEQCPFTDEDLQNGYYEGFVDGAKELLNHIETLKKEIWKKEKCLARLKKENEYRIYKISKDRKRLIRRNKELKENNNTAKDIIKDLLDVLFINDCVITTELEEKSKTFLQEEI